MSRNLRPPGKKTLKATNRALKAYFGHEKEELSSSTGARRSDRLQREGEDLAKGGQIQASHDVLTEALAHALESGNERSIARARYNLAESYKRLGEAPDRGNIVQAIELLKSALASPARQEDPFRYALTLDSMGQAKRALAALLHGEDASKCLKEAVDHFEAAIDVVEALAPVGLSPAAQYNVNLGNVWRQKGDKRKAYTHYKRAESLFKRYEGYRSMGIAEMLDFPWYYGIASMFDPPPEFGWILYSSLARALEPGQSGKEILEYCKKAREAIGNAGTLDADLLDAETLIHSGDPDLVEKGKEIITSLQATPMSEERLSAFGSLANEAGVVRCALVFFRRAQDIAFARRRQARADFVADQHLSRAQGYAKRMARLHASMGGGPEEALAAFLCLENTSSMRYHDMLTLQSYYPADSISARLYKDRQHASQLSAHYQDLANRLVYLPQEMLVEVRAELERASEAGDYGDVNLGAASVELNKKLVAGCLDALGTPTPMKALGDRSQHWADEVTRLDHLLVLHDPSYGEKRRQDFDSSEESIFELVSKHPGATFLRTCLVEDGLLAVAVWFDGEYLTGRIELLPVDVEQVSSLVSMARGEDIAARGDDDGVESLLETLSLVSLLEDAPKHALYVLPSLYTSLIPWGAVGQHGARIIDTFDELVFLPMLTPLMLEQAWSRPREGTVLVAPGDAMTPPTRFHALAFEGTREGDVELFGQDATSVRVNRESAHAEVVAFYTHGHRSEHFAGVLSLAGEELYVPDAFERNWYGCERVELWACQTGVNLPHDILTPAVDEAFGLDLEFQRIGVRSTIGTFWKVPDLITAFLVREYRRRLSEGARAPAALVGAQQWWCNEGAPGLATCLEEGSLEEAIARFADTLGARVDEIDISLEEVLGPARRRNERAQNSPEEMARIRRFLAHPLSWAGYRFSGVCGATPTRVTEDPDTELTPKEQEEYERLLNTPTPHTSLTIDEAFDEALSEARALDTTRAPTLEQAVRVARLYALHRPSARRHNLLRGLAWLHEARARAGNDRLLRVESAWLWYELAHGQCPHITDRAPGTPEPAYLLRAREAVANVPGPEASLVSRLLDVLEVRLSAPGEAPEGVAEQLHGCLGQLEEGDLFIYSRALLAVAEVFVGHEAGEPLAQRLVGMMECVPESLEQETLLQRLRCILSYIDEDVTAPSPWWLLHRQMRWSIEWLNRMASTMNPQVDIALGEHVSQAFNCMDADFWGEFFTPLAERWRYTGEPERPHRRMVGGYITQRLAQSTNERTVEHVMATLLHLGDMCIPPLQKFSALEGMISRAGHDQDVGPWTIIRLRRELLLHLEDCARIVAPNSSGVPTIHQPDVFDATIRALSQFRDARDAPGWMLTQKVVEREGITDRAAFSTECYILGLEEYLHALLSRLDTGREELDLSSFAPDYSLTRSRHALLQRAASEVILGVVEGGVDEIVYVALWSTDEGVKSRCFVGNMGDALLVWEDLWRMYSHIEELSTFDEERFSRIVGMFLPGLEEVLDGAPQGRTLSVVAPGSLRSLPWAGVIAQSPSLRGRFAGVRSSLRLTSEESRSGARQDTKILCLDGTLRAAEVTCFGSAVVSTRRSYSRNLTALEPSQPIPGGVIVEVDAMEPRAHDATSLRIYARSSNGTMNPSSEGLTLRYDRTMTTRNLSNTHFSGCQLAEIWACSGNVGEARAGRTRDRDVMPEMVRALLLSGAAAVLDIAWEIPDLTKALVYEAFGRLSHSRGFSPCVLKEAIDQVREDLVAWDNAIESFSGVEEALAWLDERRRGHFERANIVGLNLAPFAQLHRRVSSSHAELIERAARPAYLAAFRWWQL